MTPLPSFPAFRSLSRKEQAQIVWTVFRLQSQLIFSQRIVWFIGAILLYVSILYTINYTVSARDRMGIDDVYFMVLTFPLMALALYLNMQVIVSEKDQRTLEVLFTTAGSRYKVWLLRLSVLNLLILLSSFGISGIVFLTFADFSITSMACSVFVTSFLVGNLTLYVAIRLRSSLGAGMVTALILFLQLLITGIFDLTNTRYVLFFNPYDIPNQMDPRIWELWAWQNRIGALMIGMLLLFGAIRGLEDRDRLLR